MNIKHLALSASLIGLAAMGNAFAQSINVTVDGEVVPFAGQPPIEQDGSVLVPLRGVFEKLGAIVAYDGGTKTVLAVRGATAISLTIGSTRATVNGRPRILSLPAQTLNGTTLVPLRFVSEALGADVRWSGESRTVIITTRGDRPQPESPGSSAPDHDLTITSLTHDATHPLRVGEELTVTLTGTPGCNATFTIPGIEQAKDLPMREMQPGTYIGTIAMPDGVNVKHATILATLHKGRHTAPTIQSAQTLSVDTIGPTIANPSPAPDSALTSGRPVIYGTLSDSGTGVDAQATRILLNGQDITNRATVTPEFVSYKPDVDLPPGPEKVTIIARDRAGNETRADWAFMVMAEEGLIKAVSFSPNDRALGPGDVLTVRMVGRPGGMARFSISGVVNGSAMQEQTPGNYIGSYTIKKGDSLAKSPVSVALAYNGRTVTRNADRAIDIAAGAPDRPILTSPVAGANVGDTVTLAGRARPGTTVRYTIRYSGSLLILPVSGEIADGEVKANDRGEWHIEGIRLSTPVGVSKLSYQAAVVTVGVAGEQSDPVTVDFKH
jgi:hypothetical protein